jgi:hypothetical protein
VLQTACVYLHGPFKSSINLTLLVLEISAPGENSKRCAENFVLGGFLVAAPFISTSKYSTSQGTVTCYTLVVLLQELSISTCKTDSICYRV